MRTLDMKSLDVRELKDNELRGVRGGFAYALAIALLISAINNYQDIREGLYDGWIGKPRHF